MLSLFNRVASLERKYLIKNNAKPCFFEQVKNKGVEDFCNGGKVILNDNNEYEFYQNGKLLDLESGQFEQSLFFIDNVSV